MKAQKLHMIGNAHIDPVWLWQWQEGYHEVHATFRSALDRMEAYPNFVFVASSAAFYEWIEQSDPVMFREIQERVKQGRWVITGGWWVEPDCNIPCGESFVRQGLYGQLYFRKKFGLQAQTGFNVDSFGHAAALPKILQQSGIDYYVFLRPMPHEKELPAQLFRWQSGDGSCLMAFRIPFAYTFWGDDLESHARDCLAEMSGDLREMMCFYGVGNHGGGPTIRHIECINQLAADQNFPAEVLFSTPEAFFQAVQTHKESIPTVEGELQHHASGCYAAHSGIKRWNRQAENRLLAAEKWSLLADWITDQPYPTDFGRAWKNVLFNQFHDTLAGTAIEAAYEDARDTYGEALAIADRALTAAVQSLARQIHIPNVDGDMPLVVFNPLTFPLKTPIEIESSRWPSDAVLLDDQGKTIPHQSVQPATTAGRARLAFMAELPALGYRTYTLSTPPSPDKTLDLGQVIQVADHLLQSQRFRLEFDPHTGWITSLRDIQYGVEVFSGPAARPIVIDDPHDTWGHGVFRWDQIIGEFGAAQIKLVEHGPVKSVLRVSSRYGASTLIQDFSMYPDLDQIDVRLTVDWREQRKMLKLRFPVNLQDAAATFEIPYGQIERPAKGDEEPFQSWVDLSGMAQDKPYGFSLLNDGKYSLDVNSTGIGLTVLRSPVYAHHIPHELQPERDYTYMDQGTHRFQYTLYPHTGSWQQAGTVQRAAGLNQPPVALFTTCHPQGTLPQNDSFIAVAPESILVTVLKQAEGGHDLILRAYETGGLPANGVIQLPKWDRIIETAFKPGEIKTFRVPRDLSQPVRETNLLEDEI
jgi:alpha-mannosidase